MLRFRLRTLLLSMIVLAVPLGWVRWRSDYAQKQRLAVEEMERARFTAFYDYKFIPAGDRNGDYDYDPSTPVPGPEWLRAILGDYFFADVIVVAGKNPRVTGETLSPLRFFRKIEELSLITDEVSDAGWEEIAQLKSLQDLNIRNIGSCAGNVTDAKIRLLIRLPKLKHISLRLPEAVTDESIRYFGDMRSLEELRIFGSAITDEGEKQLRELLPAASIEINGSIPVGNRRWSSPSRSP
jgi:hypothetical protein